MSETEDLSLEEFEAWLATKTPTETIGYRGNAYTCPIASYLQTQHPEVSDVSVYGTSYYLGSEYRVAPRWATEFVDAVDDSGEENTRVQTRTARRLLNKVKGETHVD